MLRQLRINNYGLIQFTELEFSKGLNVLTGETGAGKSMLIDALSLILGKPAQQSFINKYSESAWVEAIFTIDNPCTEIHDFIDDKQLIIYRELNRSKGNLIRINNQTVTLKTLQYITSHIAQIIGQHAYLNLLEDDTLFAFIDEGKHSQSLLHSYRDEFHRFNAIKSKLNSLKKTHVTELEKRDFLTYQIDDIKQYNIDTDDENDLKQNKKKYVQHEGYGALLTLIQESCAKTSQDISEIDFNLNRISEDFNSLKIYNDKLINLMDTLEDICKETTQIASSLENNPLSIDDIESRLDIYFKLKQKYRVQTLTELIEKYNEMILKKESIISYNEEKNNLESKVSKSIKRLERISQDLHQERKNIGKELEQTLNNALKELEFKEANCHFKLSYNSTAFNKYGATTIEFLISTNPGSTPDKVEKVASGGELSRIMLAITKILNDNTSKTTVYDEIDSGVGGLTGLKIGQFLSEISKHRQVLCVTHLAQVAKYAHNHLLINKISTSNNTETTVKSLKINEKENELKRMIGGNVVLELFK